MLGAPGDVVLAMRPLGVQLAASCAPAVPAAFVPGGGGSPATPESARLAGATGVFGADGARA
eukprot:10984575-Lingulodinium_polyedra.AAC.1